MTTPDERTPENEIRRRHEVCRALLLQHLPRTGGLLAGGTSTIYYLTGTSANGLVWLPVEGEAVLLVRKGLERARQESPLTHVLPYRSYRELFPLCADAGAPLTPVIAVDQAGMSWEQGRMLTERLPGHEFIPGDIIPARARTVKSEWELCRMRESCRLLFLGERRIAERIYPGMSEHEIATALWAEFLALGSAGTSPTGMAGSSLLLGHIAAGENGNHPSAYDGPVGVRGAHPAAPVMGHPGSIWQPGTILTVDCGINYAGYLSDRTQIFFAGTKGALPALAREAHETAIAIARRAADALRPGAIPSVIYRQACRQAEETGFAAGFMGLGGNKVPFLGHGIGLTVSEWPIIAPGFDEPLCAGMTIALEPKIGLPGIGMVGVENTYEITGTGARSLTGDDDSIIFL